MRLKTPIFPVRNSPKLFIAHSKEGRPFKYVPIFLQIVQKGRGRNCICFVLL